MLGVKLSCGALLLLGISIVASIETCREDCRALISSVFSQTNVTLLTYTSTCPLYNEFKTCYDNKPAECRAPGPDDILVDIFNFTCNEGKEKIIRTGACWARDDVNEAIRSCAEPLNMATGSDMCSVYANYYDCLKTSMLNLCGQEAYEVLTEFSNETIRAERERYGCPAPEIVRPPMNIKCLECHSGSPSWPNTQCPAHGSLMKDMVGHSICDDSCFAKTDKWNQGVVYRGCAHNFLPQEHPRPLPRFGCREIKDEIWCFCDSNECNDMSMTPHL